MNAFSRTAFVLGLVCAMSAVSAPPLIHYQGLARNAAGSAIATPIDLTFSIYDSEHGGGVLWDETHPAVQPVDGIFSVILGSFTPITSAVFTADERWLEIEIDSEVLEPRQRLTSVPWALQAGCIPGDVLLCYPGSGSTLGQGTCSAGHRMCNASGNWGPCVGAIGPVAEICGDGLDNDCDGAADDNCPLCGDGETSAGEDCDDGNIVGGDGCSAACRFEICGNGAWDIGEECDDGNLVDGDGCNASCILEDDQVAPPDAGFNDPLDIPLDNTASVLDFVSYPGGDTQDRVRYQVTGMNPNPVFSGGTARLIIAASCFGQNTDQVQFFTSGQTYGCGQTLVDREVTADTDTGTITINAVGGTGTYVQWVLTGTATRTN